MNCRAAAQPQTQHEAHALLLKGFSPNYRGDPDVARNQSAAIPVEANCSLFLVGLAPDLTTRELLSGIRGVGRVYATHINPPAPKRGHVFSAAKVVFFERAGAELFYGLYAATGYATPRNPHLHARVSWNRVRSAEVDKGGRRSRVLLISGPPRIVNQGFLSSYLDTKMVYQVDEVVHRGVSEDRNRVLLISGPPRIVNQGFLSSYLDTKMVYQVDEVVHRGVSEDRNRVLLEFRFGSFRCQAEAARMALMREFREEGVLG
ncbi:hypothetical protein NEMBOFW57_007196 [Staphylotrichum longicolle]|uniref:Uncharacterized protein n=1 Tax=Staphylotrichum longicolle TaxID=669026 RepID=A0AAD4EU80_9PEZI|nr:hypothetical protein NEMBOFW57_007196 [Staphylotrichum longicolle]